MNSSHRDKSNVQPLALYKIQLTGLQSSFAVNCLWLPQTKLLRLSINKYTVKNFAYEDEQSKVKEKLPHSLKKQQQFR